MTRDSRIRAVLYALFTLSGFAGLIYESIWSHYLKLFLGHAAYAQTLVLVIFMGGMTIGSWLAGCWTDRIDRPLRVYAIVEALLGLGALCFDPSFRSMQAWIFDTVIPAAVSPLAIDLWKWSAGALIVLPQSILLGATFPLISAGVIRPDPAVQGKALGWLYFTNSLGASVGVLVSGFFLVARAGLPGTIVAAGIVNLALAALVLLLPGVTPNSGRDGADIAGRRLTVSDAAAPRLLAVAFLTGCASFFYEIGWIRMLSLVLGSATHAFELMLSAFIIGIALGSFLIRGRIDQSAQPLRLLAWIQVLMATAAFLSLPLYNRSFDWMAAIVHTLQPTDDGYVAFNLLSHGICLALMLPVTVFAGMTLPLITSVMMRGRSGESSIGQVYAANTLGSICGVLLAVHLVMPLLGLRQVVLTGASIDLLLGLWLFRHARPAVLAPGERVAIVAIVFVAVFVASSVRFDSASLASGVFRYGKARKQAAIQFHKDGKTASVDVYVTPDGATTIATNGKPDAAMRSNRHAELDDYTMQFLALLPVIEKPDARAAAVIGIGSGRTTHTLLDDPLLQSVDSIEIEPAMIQGARHFGAMTHQAFDDPRSRIHIEDAKTYFARSQNQYDIVIAEPSNPWVSGVSSLFSKEFYARLRHHLAPGGVFVQWVQIYEINVPLVASIVKAIDANFEDYAIYATSDVDILIVASPRGPLPPISTEAFRVPSLAADLASMDIRNLADLADRRIGTRATLRPFVFAQPLPANSDYFPVLDQLAVKYRFLNADATGLISLRRASARLEPVAGAQALPLSIKHSYLEGIYAQEASLIPGYLAEPPAPVIQPPQLRISSFEVAAMLRLMNETCDTTVLQDTWLAQWIVFGQTYLPYLPATAVREIADRIRAYRCYAQAPAVVHDWVDFIDAAGQADAAAVNRLSQSIRARSAPTAEGEALMAREGLLANLRVGDHASARAQAAGLAPDLLDDPVIAYLAANAASRP